MAVDAEHPSALIGDWWGDFSEQVTIQVKPALDIMLCGLHAGVFFLILPRDIDTVSPIIPVVAVWLFRCVVDDSPADEVNIGGLFIGDFISHFIGAVADLPYPVFVLIPLI